MTPEKFGYHATQVHDGKMYYSRSVFTRPLFRRNIATGTLEYYHGIHGIWIAIPATESYLKGLTS